MGIFDKFFSLFAKAGPQPEPLVAPVASKPVERRCRDRMNACPGTRVLIIDDSRTIDKKGIDVVLAELRERGEI